MGDWMASCAKPIVIRGLMGLTAMAMLMACISCGRPSGKPETGSPSESPADATSVMVPTPTAPPTPAFEPTSTIRPAPAFEPTSTVRQETGPLLQPDSQSFYVAKTGNDMNPGSLALPFLTIQRAIDQAPDDSTIFVLAGTYPGPIKIVDKSGLLIQKQGDPLPVISGKTAADGYLVEIAGSQGIILRGFELCDFVGSDLEGIYIRNGCSDIEISQCRIHDISTNQPDGDAHAILVKGTGPKPLTNIRMTGNEFSHCQTGTSEAVTVESNVDGFAIIDNSIHDISNIGIDVAGFYASEGTPAGLNQARNGLIAGNTVSLTVSPYATCAGIYVDGGRDITIEKNTVHHSMYGIEIGCENATDRANPEVQGIVKNIIVRQNLVFLNSRAGIVAGGYNGTATGVVKNSLIEHNTTYMNRIELVLATSESLRIENNIFYSQGGAAKFIEHDPVNPVTLLVMDHNLYYSEADGGTYQLQGQKAQQLSDWQAFSGQDKNSQFADPLFMDPSRSDFRLQAGSPAAGKGAFSP